MGRGGGGRTQETTENITLLRNHRKESDGDLIKRTGTVYTAVAHIITAVVGSGVLSLSWSVAQLGWIAGPVAILFFAAVTLVQATLLADCYRSPDPEHGHIRNKSYMGAVKQNLGAKSHLFCSFLQLTNMYGCCVAYTITAAASIREWNNKRRNWRGSYAIQISKNIASLSRTRRHIICISILCSSPRNREHLEVTATGEPDNE